MESIIDNELTKSGISYCSFNKNMVRRILDTTVESKHYTFVDIISELKPLFLNNNTNTPTLEYIQFMTHIMSTLELYSVDELKTIERFSLRMDEDALSGIVKYHNKITTNDVSYLLKKYKIDRVLICEIIKKDHVNISNTLINMLARNIRINKPMCKYSSNCYRKNNEHLKTYLH